MRGIFHCMSEFYHHEEERNDRPVQTLWLASKLATDEIRQACLTRFKLDVCFSQSSSQRAKQALLSPT